MYQKGSSLLLQNISCIGGSIISEVQCIDPSSLSATQYGGLPFTPLITMAKNWLVGDKKTMQKRKITKFCEWCMFYFAFN